MFFSGKNYLRFLHKKIITNQFKYIMKRIATMVILLFVTSNLIVSTAQVHPNRATEGTVEILNNTNSDSNPQEVFNVLIENAPEEPTYPNLPRFALVGKDNKFYFSVGATLKATTSFDWGNPLNDPALFIPAAIAPVTPGNGGELQMTVKRSMVNFNFVALPGTDNQFGVYINLYFSGNGNNYGAALQHAYAKWRGFTVGYKNTLYADGAASPYTIDTEGPNSAPGIWNTCLDYEHAFGGKFKMGAGLELPLYSVTSTSNSLYRIDNEPIIGKASSVSQRIPDIPMYVQYTFNSNGHIRFTGLLRTLTYRDEIFNKNKNKMGYGLKLSGFYNFGPIVAYWMGQYGKGMASYMQDNYDLGLDLVPSSTIPGEMQLTKGWGGYLGLQFNFSKKLFSTLLYSHLRNYMEAYNGGDLTYSNQYQWGQYACANMIYSCNPFMQLGVEYLYGRRMNFDKDQVHDNRIQAMFQITF